MKEKKKSILKPSSFTSYTRTLGQDGIECTVVVTELTRCKSKIVSHVKYVGDKHVILLPLFKNNYFMTQKNIF